MEGPSLNTQTAPSQCALVVWDEVRFKPTCAPCTQEEERRSGQFSHERAGYFKAQYDGGFLSLKLCRLNSILWNSHSTGLRAPFSCTRCTEGRILGPENGISRSAMHRHKAAATSTALDQFLDYLESWCGERYGAMIYTETETQVGGEDKLA